MIWVEEFATNGVWISERLMSRPELVSVLALKGHRILLKQPKRWASLYHIQQRNP